MKVAKTLIISILFLFFTILFAGGGHGTYLPALIVYPYTMIIAKLQLEIGFVGFFLALIEIPLYGYIWFNKPNWKYYIFGIHMLGVVISFLIKSEVFN
ncbi:hypothetical protein [Flavobacterium sp. MDT1-60]|uniref:hypothetical protein n=1 Tax=Flavobacterium sp. MDT1-60 TaxID=1979344 RepID=UPI00177F5C79|nr:hypothetical protein [Flavobacterium sp. MDT1-60]QOG00870.1 hypothetical protein IHE43_13705 [Flavobacterium sp. MDT1-60]